MPLTAANALREGDDPEQDYLWTLNFGPQHPATHTTLRLVLKLEGERVVDARPDIGFLHSGFEKLAEHLDYNQYVTVTDRMNYISPMANNVAWHLAVEKLLGIDVPPRTKYIRVIVAELARISDHLLCTGAMGLDVGAFTFFLYAFYQREMLYDVFESLCGARFTNSYTRVGGLMHDMTPTTIDKIRRFVQDFPRTLDDMERLLNRNRIFHDRMKGVGVLTREEAVNRSCSGPVARASGVTRDLRKDEPYLSYADFDFRVCCATAGDCFARYYVRMAEMRESLAIVHQAVENLPSRPDQCGPGPALNPASQGRRLPHDRRHDHAFRADHEQPRIRGAVRRDLCGDRGGQRRTWLLSGGRRRECRVPRPLPSPVADPLCIVPALDPRAHVERRCGRARQPEYHRGRAGPVK